jgi:hypothetical protein
MNDPAANSGVLKNNEKQRFRVQEYLVAVFSTSDL